MLNDCKDHDVFQITAFASVGIFVAELSNKVPLEPNKVCNGAEDYNTLF